MGVPISQVPRSDRPRERLLASGREPLSDVELVAILLGAGANGRSCLETAAELLAKVGGLGGLGTFSTESLLRCPGIGPARAATLVAACEIGRRREQQSVDGCRIESAEDAAALVVPKLRDRRHESVMVLVLDRGSRLVRLEEVAKGSDRRSTLPVREILSLVFRAEGSQFVVAHNHPSGDLEPSDADRLATDALRAAALTTGLRFLDHLIVAASGFRSIG